MEQDIPKTTPADLHSSTILLRLRHSTLFENLSDEQFNAVRSRLIERRYSRDDVIVDERAGGDRVFIIADGRVKITKRTRFGEETLFALLHHGDFFGGGELIDGRPRRSRVVAVDDCLMYELPRANFDQLLHESHPFSVRLIQVLSVRLNALDHYFMKEIDRNAERSRLELDRLQNLVEAAKVVNSTLELDRLLGIILDTSLKIVQADRGTLYLIDEVKQELWSKILKGLELVEIRLPIGKGLAGYVAATGDVINIPDAYLDARFNPDVDARTGYRTKSILCVPMRNKENKIIGVLQLFNKIKGQFAADDISILEALSVHASIAIENARLYEQEQQKIALEKDLQAARDVQMALLPKVPPTIDGYDFTGIMIPAQAVGGDYFDFIRLDQNRLGVCVGDVSGKGLPAALLMANLQANLRAQTIMSPVPKIALGRINNLLTQSTGADKFITLFFGIVDFGKHIFTFCNAGHNPPLMFSNDPTPQQLTAGGIVLGVLHDFSFEEETVALSPKDLIVMYSDGVTEAMNKQQEQFGEERLVEVIAAHRHDSADKVCTAIVVAVSSFSEGAAQADDITVLVLKRV